VKSLTYSIGSVVARQGAFSWRWAVVRFEHVTGLQSDIVSGTCLTSRRADARASKEWQRISGDKQKSGVNLGNIKSVNGGEEWGGKPE